MLVRQILSSKPSHNILSVSPQSTVSDAVGLLSSNRIGALMVFSSCAPTDTAVSVLGKMTEGRFRHMPVVEDGAIVGVISIGDVVKARIDEVEHENSALTEMIAGHA